VGSYLKDMARYPMLEPAAEEQLQQQLITARREIEETLLLLGIEIDVDGWVSGPRVLPAGINTEEEALLLERLSRAEAAFDQVVDRYWRHNLRMVISIVKRFTNRGSLDLEDLIQEGNLALRKAIQKYRPETGYKLITYATRWIRSKVGRYIQTYGYTIGHPSHVNMLMNCYRKEEARLRQEFGQADQDMLAERLEMSAEKLEELRQLALSQLPLSVDATVDPEGEGVSYVELIGDPKTALPDAELIAIEMGDLLRKKFDTLRPREQQILRKRLAEDLTLQEIGDQMGLTRERIRQIHQSLSERMRVLLLRNEIDCF
jgi:RNA polymerase sigma factor (sigma-70 family)